jgi:hypothetical protein
MLGMLDDNPDLAFSKIYDNNEAVGENTNHNTMS